jgi:glyoxylase-like metal-dependent hydrolase (beta-lactamase superfamily II)
MATGDLFVVIDRAPVIDYAAGGTTVGWLPTLDNMLKFDFDRAIPGHGPVASRADVLAFKQKIITLQARTRELIKQGLPPVSMMSSLTRDSAWRSSCQSTVFQAPGGSHGCESSWRGAPIADALREIPPVASQRA